MLPTRQERLLTMTKKLYLDLVTTNPNFQESELIGIAGIIEDGDIIKEHFNINIQPFSEENIDKKHLEKQKVKIYDLKTYEEPAIAFEKLNRLFDKNVDKYDKTDKFEVCSYNVNFDIKVLNKFFERNGSNYFYSYFGGKKDPYSVLKYLYTIKKLRIENLEIRTVAKYFGIELEEDISLLNKVNFLRNLVAIIDSRLSLSSL